mgnify:CR=1 FL=1
MKQLPQGGIIGKTAAAAKTIAALNIPFRAAYGAYFLILSAFPALLLILNSLRFTQLSVADLTGALENILPEALMDSVQELILSTYRNASSAVAGVSVLTLLWSSSKGIYGLLKGLNAVYGVEEDRGLYPGHQRCVCAAVSGCGGAHIGAPCVREYPDGAAARDSEPGGDDPGGFDRFAGNFASGHSGFVILRHLYGAAQ